MPPQPAWQLVKAYQDAIAAGTLAHRFSADEQAGERIVKFGVLQAYAEAERRAEEATLAGNHAIAALWTSVHHLLSTCLRPP